MRVLFSRHFAHFWENKTLTKISEFTIIKRALSHENLILLHANNKGADQPMYPCSLISALVMISLESITKYPFMGFQCTKS